MPMSPFNPYVSGDLNYLENLKVEAELLTKAMPEEGTFKHARLAFLLARIEQLTSPITVPDWELPEGM